MQGGELASGAHLRAPWEPTSSVSEALEAWRKSCGSWHIPLCPTPPGPSCIRCVPGVGLSEDGSLVGWGGVLVDAAVGLDRTAVSASPLVPPGLDGTLPSAPDPGSPPSVLLHLAFDATQVLLGSAGGQHGARLGALPEGTTVWRKLNREQVAKCQVALCSHPECPEVEATTALGAQGEGFG